MGFLKDFIANRKERDRKIEEWSQNDRIGGLIEERKKSHGERELEKVLEKEKQEAIRDALHWENKRREAQDRLNARGMMKFNPEFFNQDVVLKQKNIFLRGGYF